MKEISKYLKAIFFTEIVDDDTVQSDSLNTNLLNTQNIKHSWNINI